MLCRKILFFTAFKITFAAVFDNQASLEDIQWVSWSAVSQKPLLLFRVTGLELAALCCNAGQRQ